MFELEYLPILEHSIDDQIYKMIVMRANFSKEKVVQQFSTDVETLISIFGGNDMRKIRSAKIILTQVEEKFLDCEISDNDIEKPMMAVNIV